jgi:hypothetical protein
VSDDRFTIDIETEKEIRAQDREILHSKTYGIISPPSEGVWLFAAFSKTSMRRPVI